MKLEFYNTADLEGDFHYFLRKICLDKKYF